MEKLYKLPEGAEVEKSLTRLRERVEELGVEVEDDFSVPDHARFIGIFEDNTITLYPKVAVPFACWFTVAHLYGHMTQLLNKTPRVNRSNYLVWQLGKRSRPKMCRSFTITSAKRRKSADGLLRQSSRIFHRKWTRRIAGFFTPIFTI